MLWQLPLNHQSWIGSEILFKGGQGDLVSDFLISDV